MARLLGVSRARVTLLVDLGFRPISSMEEVLSEPGGSMNSTHYGWIERLQTRWGPA